MDDHEILKSNLSRRWSVCILACDSLPILEPALIARSFKPFTAGELAGLLAKTLPKAGEGKYRTSLRSSGRVLLPMTIFLSHPFFLAAAAGHGEQRATIFFAQVLLLIAVGRLLG
jgi:hypothetical protein